MKVRVGGDRREPVQGVSVEEPKGIDEVYAATYASVVAVAAHLLGDLAGAEDVAQDAFMRLAAETGHIENPGNWLRTVAYRSAISEIRRRDRERRAHHRSARMADRAPVDVPETLVTDEFRGLGDAMSRLPFMQRASALMCWGDDLTTREVADLLGCSVATVRVHLHRARKALQAGLDEGSAP